MKINQNKSNHFLKKLCAKSFINTKKEDTLFNKTNKKLERRYFLKTSSSTKRTLRKDDSSERYNTLRENFKNRKMMNQDLLKTDEHIINNKKRSVSMQWERCSSRISFSGKSCIFVIDIETDLTTL